MALNAPGAREVVVDGENGRLIDEGSVEAFSTAFRWVAEMTPAQRTKLGEASKTVATRFSREISAQKALSIYQDLLGRAGTEHTKDDSALSETLNLIKAEWNLLKGMAIAAEAALTQEGATNASS